MDVIGWVDSWLVTKSKCLFTTENLPVLTLVSKKSYSFFSKITHLCKEALKLKICSCMNLLISFNAHQASSMN